MKTTYLVNDIQADGTCGLVETTAEHWHEITEHNKLLQERRANAFPLMLREYQNVLHEYDGMPITNGTNDTQKLIVLVSSKGQH